MVKVREIKGSKGSCFSRANPHNYTAEMRLTFPWTHLEMDYDVNGQLLIVPLRSKGYFNGNFSKYNHDI